MAYAFLGRDDRWAETIDGGAQPGADGFDQRNWNGANTPVANVAKTGNQQIDGLLSGVKWKGAITYSAPDALGDYQAGYFTGFNTAGFSQFTGQQLAAFHFALNTSGASAGFSVSGFTNLSASFIGAGSGAATIRGANMADANPTAYAYYPSASQYGGDTFFGLSQDGTSSSLKTPKAGNWAWHTMMHEIGHSLGLKHGHETGGVAGALPRAVDSVEFSIMTYRGYIGGAGDGYSYEHWGAPQTFMMLDIAALQRMYGPDFTTNKGNTVYKWRPTSGDTLVNGKVAIDAGGNRIFATVWDGGGIDTYDLSSYKTPVKIDLKPGGHSVFSEAQLANLGGGPNDGFARGNIFNALQYNGNKRSLIENAIGGSGNDQINGNNADNNLKGAHGNDRLWGHSGNDVLQGGPGNDLVYGGAGNDRLNGDAGNDMLRGGDGNDVAYGGAGNDRLLGDAGNDILFGGEGRDRLDGGAGNDKLYGGNSIDLIYGGAGADIAYGGAHADKLYGGAGNDRLFGDAGNDLLRGGIGADRLDGGSGNDLLYGDTGNDFLYGGAGNDKLYGGSGTDRLYGGRGDDYIYGGSGKDYAYYTGRADDYDITDNGSTTIVNHRGGPDGIDRLIGVEYIVFSDEILVL